jgi:hypothetical protein
VVDGVDYGVFSGLESLKNELRDSASATAQVDDLPLLADFGKIEQSFVDFGVER